MEENTNIATENQNVNQNEPAQEELSFEDRYAELLAENKRLKRASDKASSEAAEYKKKYNEKLSETERAAMKKAEEQAAVQEELQTLRKKVAVSEFTKSFMGLGYDEKQAAQAAEAQYSGDYVTLNALQRQHQDNMEKRIRSELMKSMPSPNIGNDDTITVTQEQFDKMSYQEQLKLYREHPTVYAKLAN